jgi:hypothetical protein
VWTRCCMFPLSPAPLFVMWVYFFWQDPVEILQGNGGIVALNVTANQACYHTTKNSLMEDMK